jgi:paraquat-inducible protein B
LPSEPLAPHLRHRVSIVWLIPAVAALAAAWLAWQALAAHGPAITITFLNAEGLEAGKTKVEHNNVELGLIESLEPTADFTHVVATVQMGKSAEGHLGKDTRFWIVRPRLSIEGISGLSTLISGAYVELDPGPGPDANQFAALDRPPVISGNEPGRTFTLRAPRLGSTTEGDPVYYRGVEVGQVLGDDLSNADSGVTVRVFVRAPYDDLVREGTRFWNASGVTVTAGSDGLKIRSESLLAMLAGGIDFDVPADGQPGTVARPNASFTLYDDAGAANDAVYIRKARFLLHFPGSVENLKPGNDVRMQGMRIGEVADVHMEFDAATDRVSVPVLIDIEADRVKLLHDSATPSDFEQRAYATFGRFIARGLRARLASASLITGQKVVDLDFVPDALEMKMSQNGAYPEIPAIPAEDLDTVVASANDLLGSLQVTAAKLNGIVSSPAVMRSVHSLDSSLANLDYVSRDARAGIGPLITALRAAAESADAALKQASGTLVVAKNALDSRSGDGGDLAGTLREIENAARSLRILADYLESHPNSLLFGKSGGVMQ